MKAIMQAYNDTLKELKVDILTTKHMSPFFDKMKLILKQDLGPLVL